MLLLYRNRVLLPDKISKRRRHHRAGRPERRRTTLGAGQNAGRMPRVDVVQKTRAESRTNQSDKLMRTEGAQPARNAIHYRRRLVVFSAGGVKRRLHNPGEHCSACSMTGDVGYKNDRVGPRSNIVVKISREFRARNVL